MVRGARLAASIAIVTALLVLLGVLIFNAHGIRHTGAPLAVVVGLALISLTLALAAYWDCHDETHPRFFTPLMWTAGVVKGGTADQSLNAGTCPSPTPVALEIARLCALSPYFSASSEWLWRSSGPEWTVLRVFFAHSVTALVGIDDDSEPMVAAVARTLGHRSTMVVVTSLPDRHCVSAAREHGASIITVDFSRPESLTSLSFWRKLDRLYLLSMDPSNNLQRLDLITERLSEVGQRHRLPLIVRIDDPWQADGVAGATFRRRPDSLGSRHCGQIRSDCSTAARPDHRRSPRRAHPHLRHVTDDVGSVCRHGATSVGAGLLLCRRRRGTAQSHLGRRERRRVPARPRIPAANNSAYRPNARPWRPINEDPSVPQLMSMIDPGTVQTPRP